MVISFKQFLMNEAAPIKLPIPWQYWQEFMPFWSPNPNYQLVPVDDDGNEVNPDGTPVKDDEPLPFRPKDPYYFDPDTPWLQQDASRRMHVTNVTPPTTN